MKTVHRCDKFLIDLIIGEDRWKARSTIAFFLYFFVMIGTLAIGSACLLTDLGVDCKYPYFVNIVLLIVGVLMLTGFLIVAHRASKTVALIVDQPLEA